MDSTPVSIQEWAELVKNCEPLKWERLPEIELYMDQVITYMEKHLNFYRRNRQSKTLTPSMINNYVKDALLPRPDKKKYAREHLAALMMICLLKPVLSIPDLTRLLQNLRVGLSAEQLYDMFSNVQNQKLRHVGGHVGDAAQENDRHSLAVLALNLSLEAAACRIAAEKILETLESDPAQAGGSAEEAQ